METVFFLMRAFRYKESGKWEYKLINMYPDIPSVKQAYFSNMAAIIKDTNDFAMCVIFDNWGNRIEADYLDTHENVPDSEE